MTLQLTIFLQQSNNLKIELSMCFYCNCFRPPLNKVVNVQAMLNMRKIIKGDFLKVTTSFPLTIV